MHTWTADQREELINLWTQGKTVQEICQHFDGLPHRAMHHALSRFATAEDRAARRRVLVEAMRALMRDGVGRLEIISRLSLPHPVYDDLMSLIDKGEVRQWHSRVHMAVRTRAYTTEQCLAALREAVALNGQSLAKQDYTRLRRSHPEWPGLSTLDRYRSWSEWLVDIGQLVPRRALRLGYDEAACIAALVRVWRYYGRAYSEDEYDKARLETEPIGVTLRRRLGRHGWVDVLQHVPPIAD